MVDVRPELEFLMYHLPNTVNIPYSIITGSEGIDVFRKIVLNENVDLMNGKIFV